MIAVTASKLDEAQWDAFLGAYQQQLDACSRWAVLARDGDPAAREMKERLLAAIGKQPQMPSAAGPQSPVPNQAPKTVDRGPKSPSSEPQVIAKVTQPEFSKPPKVKKAEGPTGPSAESREPNVSSEISSPKPPASTPS